MCLVIACKSVKLRMMIIDDDDDDDHRRTWGFPVERSKLNSHWYNLRSCREAAWDKHVSYQSSFKVVILVYY